MGFLGKVVDAILLLTFFSVSLVIPFLDAQAYLPEYLFPDVLVRVYKWYSIEHQDYLLLEKPRFFIALMKLELVFQLPLALLNIYGLLSSKPWFNYTLLLFGASLITSTTAMVGDMIGSQKPSADKLVMMYSPFLVSGVLAVLRGLVSQLSKPSPTTIGNGPASALKKKA